MPFHKPDPETAAVIAALRKLGQEAIGRELDEVLDAMVATEESPGPAVLDRWLCRYPQFERELVDFMASWALMESAVSPPDRGADEALVLRGQRAVQKLLRKASQEADLARAVIRAAVREREQRERFHLANADAAATGGALALAEFTVWNEAHRALDKAVDAYRGVVE